MKRPHLSTKYWNGTTLEYRRKADKINDMFLFFASVNIIIGLMLDDPSNVLMINVLPLIITIFYKITLKIKNKEEIETITGGT